LSENSTRVPQDNDETAGRKNRHEGDTFPDSLSADNEGYLRGGVHWEPVLFVDHGDWIKMRNWQVMKHRRIGKYFRLTQAGGSEPGTGEGCRLKGLRPKVRG
jgi:hypothetical protein